jgi:hypothetical protein
MALVLAGIAFWQRGLAQESQRQAESERDRALAAQSRAMSSLANQLRREGDPTTSTLVGIEAAERVRLVRVGAEAAVADVEDSLLASYS